MIYLSIPLKQILIDYPNLPVISIRCKECGNLITADKPVALHPYKIGLASDKQCICGESVEQVVVFCNKKTKKERLCFHWQKE